MELELLGCPPQPLASYLKGLGVLRLVSEQVDSDARGWWVSGCFVLASPLDQEGLLNFFLAKFRPTPVLAPWNGGSGFYPKDRKVGMNAITACGDQRFENYRLAILAAQEVLKKAGAEKGASKAEEDERRTDILRLCRNELPDECIDWLDAAIAIGADGSRAFAPILGTGGNEGRLDYTNNFMENLAGLLIAPDKKTPVRALLENALLDKPTMGLREISVGQYEPGRSGGFNQGQGIEANGIANPWSAVLTVEGAISWAGGIYRKQGVSYRSFLCSPFTVRPSAVGYGSAAQKDQGTARAEIWTPLWKQPARYCEIRALLREGRAAVDEPRTGFRPAKTGLEFAQAAASLGVDRGIDAFVRYSLVKRRGDSYIALPAGRFGTRYRRGSDLVRELAPLVDSAERAAKGTLGEAPNSWAPLRHAVEDAMYDVLLRDDPHSVRDTAAAFGKVYRWLLDRDRAPSFGRPLSGDWVTRCSECEETAAEVRVAAALALMRHSEAGPFESNLTRGDPHFSWTGRDLPERMLSTLRRRLLSGRETNQSPLRSTARAWPADIARFLEGRVDDALIEDLIFAFVLVKDPNLGAPDSQHRPWPVYCLLKQLFLPNKIVWKEVDVRIAPDLTIPALLSAGRIDEAAAIAARRLRSAGLNPMRARYGETCDARRLGASLLIPVTSPMNLLASVLEPRKRDENDRLQNA